MAMATKPKKKSASSKARPMGRPQTVTSNVEPQSQLKALELRKLLVQPTPAAANTNRTLKEARELHERQQIRQARLQQREVRYQVSASDFSPLNAGTSSRQALKIKAKKKVHHESITNDPRAPPKLKEELPRVDTNVNKYIHHVQQSTGKRNITKEEAKVLVREGKTLLKEMQDVMEIVEQGLNDDDDDGDGSPPNSGAQGVKGCDVASDVAVSSLNTRADESEGCAENETAPGGAGSRPNKNEKWYHRFLQWLHDKVSAIWHALRETVAESLQFLANLWARFMEWIKRKIRSLLGNGDDMDDAEQGDARV